MDLEERAYERFGSSTPLIIIIIIIIIIFSQKGSRPAGQALRCRGNYMQKAQELGAAVSRETRVREK